MKFVKAIAATAALATLAATPVLAQNSGLAADGRLVRSVTLDDLKAIFVAEGHTVDNSLFSGDAPVVIATAPSGLKFAAFGTACTGTEAAGNVTCNGINFMATWGATPENSDPAKINELNESKAAVSVFASGDSVGISRYVILDGGMNVENIKWNMRVFLSICDQLKGNF